MGDYFDNLTQLLPESRACTDRTYKCLVKVLKNNGRSRDVVALAAALGYLETEDKELRKYIPEPKKHKKATINTSQSLRAGLAGGSVLGVLFNLSHSEPSGVQRTQMKQALLREITSMVKEDMKAMGFTEKRVQDTLIYLEETPSKQSASLLHALMAWKDMWQAGAPAISLEMQSQQIKKLVRDLSQSESAKAEKVKAHLCMWKTCTN
ncbi:putative matrix protein 1 [Rainbow trout orthomyxovirus-1]|uniref:Matrix protein 1 n=1 Tax=Rainbow trout orthomyxovirus-1 TaxID=1954184 RepID=A0A1Q1MMF5_9ORTO|nr:putative matrix protein 1 [Rainbow trout orthomyxovirus-1]AQM37681.1 putative matrix protein 1 [Rainbow trout orthomyxovirus-1]